ncbi:hypothetical protein GIB67_021704 [Kingdonia uniflora]|uniref:Uncharacterized protein n=1 Tax=Kingdonia uniflora TaxID=39325 RepID=A0A7J7LMH8_9MAGN|nr:hypothetical protein GIB67_021704 [Kingdonia uniflora]
MGKKTPKKMVEASTQLLMESNKELTKSNKMMSKQLEVMLANLCALAGFDSDGRFADAIEDEVEIGEKKIIEKVRLEAGVVMEDSKKFDGDGLEMKHHEETTEREVHRAINLIGGKDGDVATLMREVHVINDFQLLGSPTPIQTLVKNLKNDRKGIDYIANDGGRITGD